MLATTGELLVSANGHNFYGFGATTGELLVSANGHNFYGFGAGC